jgi:hypothetical protein
MNNPAGTTEHKDIEGSILHGELTQSIFVETSRLLSTYMPLSITIQILREDRRVLRRLRLLLLRLLRRGEDDDGELVHSMIATHKFSFFINVRSVASLN